MVIVRLVQMVPVTYKTRKSRTATFCTGASGYLHFSFKTTSDQFQNKPETFESKTMVAQEMFKIVESAYGKVKYL